ncbi:MAG: hypothetical protein ABIQ47_06975 [Tepidiformaceae bacterium]
MAVIRGTLAAWLSPTATVRLEGSAPQTITTDKKAANILAADMVVTRKVLIDAGDHNDPADFVIYAVWA